MIFQEPIFNEHGVELRCENGEVCIYATEQGLHDIINFCEKLIKKPKIGHIHLEDYDILTANSLKGTIAIFSKE